MKARIKLSPSNIHSPIDDRLYSSFVEHMGRAVYTGLYEPGHPSADEQGFRQDIMEYIKPLELSFIRYPGGNFVSGYNWRDGIGPRENRPVRRDLAWFALEPNHIGVHEFTDWCKQVGAKPMMAVNLGTGTPKDAAELLEYCNVEKGTQLSDLRRSHGWEQPHDIKLWCLGNEMDGPWQICGKTAEEYGRVAHETAKMMKWMDPSIELVACGSSYREMPTFGDWERTVLRHCWDDVEYLSLHSYYRDLDKDSMSFLSCDEQMDGFIKEVVDICNEIKAEKGSDKDIYLSFDEWNVWYHFAQEQPEPEKWTFPRAIEEEEYNILDTLAMGALITALINNSDSVKISCMAQLLNVLAPIMTVPGGPAWVQSTYWPYLHACRFGRGSTLNIEKDAPLYDCAAKNGVSYLSAAAVLSKDESEVTLFLVNKNLDEAMELDIEGLGGKMEQWISIEGYGIYDINGPENCRIAPSEKEICDTSKVTLGAGSWNVIRIKL